MDTESQKVFDAIVALGPDALDEGQKAILRARASYLTADQREAFAEVLEDQVKPLSKMTLDELRAVAAERNVELDPADTKAKVLAKIEAAQ